MQNENQNSKLKIKYRAFKFSIAVIKYLETIKTFGYLRVVFEQLVGSATSVGANAVEAEGSASKREFIKFFGISRKSAKETIYWLCIIKELGYGDKDELDKLIKEARRRGIE